MNNLIDLNQLKSVVVNCSASSEEYAEQLSDMMSKLNTSIMTKEEWEENYSSVEIAEPKSPIGVVPIELRTSTIIPDWSVITRSKTLGEAIEEHMAMHKLTPASCVNCGGRIDKDTMTCCYCGTFYR